MTFWRAFLSSHPKEAIEEGWQKVEVTEVGVDPYIRSSSDTQLMKLAIQQFRAGQTVPPYNLDHSLGAVKRAF